MTIKLFAFSVLAALSIGSARADQSWGVHASTESAKFSVSYRSSYDQYFYFDLNKTSNLKATASNNFIISSENYVDLFNFDTGEYVGGFTFGTTPTSAYFNNIVAGSYVYDVYGDNYATRIGQVDFSSTLINTIPQVGAIISGLHNTATSSSIVKDSNYTVTGNGVNGNGYTTINGPWPIGPWIANTSTSGWLSPSNNQGAGFSNTIYDWKTTFDLTGFNTASASFNGRFAADDSAVAYLNGTQIGISNGFGSWSNFVSQPGAFLAGLNTLDFMVNNSGGGPTGLRTEFLGSSETAVPATSAVPEPKTYSMLLAGLVLMIFMTHRRKSI